MYSLHTGPCLLTRGVAIGLHDGAPMGMHSFDRLPDSPAKAGAVLSHQTVRENLDDVRICFSGEIDLSNSDQVDAAVTAALRTHHPRHVYVDLAEVSFLDASGIRALLRCRAQAVEAGCRLAATNPQPTIYRVMEITGVLEALAVTGCPAWSRAPEVA